MLNFFHFVILHSDETNMLEWLYVFVQYWKWWQFSRGNVEVSWLVRKTRTASDNESVGRKCETEAGNKQDDNSVISETNLYRTYRDHHIFYFFGLKCVSFILALFFGILFNEKNIFSQNYFLKDYKNNKLLIPIVISGMQFHLKKKKLSV